MNEWLYPASSSHHKNLDLIKGCRAGTQDIKKNSLIRDPRTGLETAITRTPLATALILANLSGDTGVTVPCLASAMVSLYITLYRPFIASQRDRSDVTIKASLSPWILQTTQHQADAFMIYVCTHFIMMACLALITMSLYITLYRPFIAPQQNLTDPVPKRILCRSCQRKVQPLSCS